MTREVANELWIAREILSKRGGDRRSADFNDANASLKTWSEYCVEIGINYTIAHHILLLPGPALDRLNSKDKR
jgi:hypothetical protein